jgi:cyclin-dependent kinase-like
MAELITGQPLFPGRDDLDQLYAMPRPLYISVSPLGRYEIQKLLGPLSDEQCEMFSKNPLYVGMKLPISEQVKSLERMYLGKCCKSAISFLKVRRDQ